MVSTKRFNPTTAAANLVASQRTRQPDTWEPARRERAGVLIDGELFRISITRREYSEHRLWVYGHQFAKGEGRILRSELFKSIQQLGIVGSKRTFDDILQRGNGLYWRQRGHYIYFTGWQKLAAKLTAWEAKHHPDRVATNLPGQRRVWVDLRCTALEGHARVFNAWVSIKAAKLGYLDISYWTLTRLWNRTASTIRNWGRVAGMRVEQRYAEHHDIHNPLIPAHAILCLDTDGNEFTSHQLSNRYIPAHADIHDHNGQRRKVRAACRIRVDKSMPPVLRAGGPRRLQRTGRITFHDKSGKNGFSPAHKQLNRHLKKHNDIFDRPHYAFMTRRYGKHIYEMSDGTPVRRATAQRDRLAEQSPAFRQRAQQYRIGWVTRMEG